MRILEIIGVLLLSFALYYWYIDRDDGGEDKVKAVREVYEGSLEKLGFAEEKLEKEYEKLDEID